MLAVVSGPPGQGKTRVVEELVTRIGDQAAVLLARCRPAGEQSPLEPLRQLLDATSAEGVHARAVRIISDPLEADRVADVLSHSAGLRSSDALRGMPVADRQDEITNAWRRYLASLARERPVVAWVEDLHWADPQLVALIDRLTLSGNSPLLFVVTARPEFAQQAGIRPTGQRFFIDLDPLAADEELRLAALAGGSGDPITSRAEGNPLFIIELARARSLRDDALPMTLRGAIGARLDDVPERERQILQASAIVGEAFTARDTAMLLSRDLGEVHASLEHLVDLLYLRSGADGAYRFHHGLVREVAYGQLPIAERLRLHARYAREGLAPDDHGRRAYHLWEAIGGPDAAWVWEDVPERLALRRDARQSLLASAQASASAFLTEAGIVQARRALELADSALDRAEAHRALGDVYLVAAAGDEALAELTAAIAAYREAGVTRPAHVYATIGRVVSSPGGLRVLPDQGEIDRLLADGLTAARAEGDALGEATLLVILAERSDSADRRRQLFDEARAIVDRADDQVPFVEILGRQASNEGREGQELRAKEILDHAWALASRDPRARTDILSFISANNAFALGDLDALEATTSRYERAAAAAGPHQRMHPQYGRAMVAFCRADWQATRDVARYVARTIDEHPETVFCIAAGMALGWGASAAAMSADMAEARDLLTRARRIAELPNVGEVFLAGAFASLGLRGDVLRLDDSTPVESWTEDLAAALAAIDEWERVRRHLPVLELRAANSGRFSGALAAALREELAVREGGPAPRHAALHEIGYVGFSELLRFRPRTD